MPVCDPNKGVVPTTYNTHVLTKKSSAKAFLNIQVMMCTGLHALLCIEYISPLAMPLPNLTRDDKMH